MYSLQPAMNFIFILVKSVFNAIKIYIQQCYVYIFVVWCVPITMIKSPTTNYSTYNQLNCVCCMWNLSTLYTHAKLMIHIICVLARHKIRLCWFCDKYGSKRVENTHLFLTEAALHILIVHGSFSYFIV